MHVDKILITYRDWPINRWWAAISRPTCLINLLPLPQRGCSTDRFGRSSLFMCIIGSYGTLPESLLYYLWKGERSWANPSARHRAVLSLELFVRLVRSASARSTCAVLPARPARGC